MPETAGSRLAVARAVLRLILAAFYYAAGVWHLTIPSDFVAIMPPWVPATGAVVMFTGWCELLGATGLLIPRLRRFAGVMLAIYAVCVFPANIRQALDHIPFRGHVAGWSYNGPRLALQPILVWWALFAGGAVTWPFRRPSPQPTP